MQMYLKLKTKFFSKIIIVVYKFISWAYYTCAHTHSQRETNMTGLVISVQFSSVQSLSPVRLFATPWITARQASLSITISQSSLKLTSIESVMPSSHLILCRPLFLLPLNFMWLSYKQWIFLSNRRWDGKLPLSWVKLEGTVVLKAASLPPVL